MSDRLKIVAESVKENQHSPMYRIWNNGEVEYYNSYNRAWGCQNYYTFKDNFIDAMKNLKPGKQYRFCHSMGRQTKRDPFFRTTRAHTGVLINFYGFDPIKCKECGLGTETRVCPHCGEWQYE